MSNRSWTLNFAKNLIFNSTVVEQNYSRRINVSGRVLIYFVLLLINVFLSVILLTIALCVSISISDNQNQLEIGKIWLFNKSETSPDWNLTYTSYQYALLIIFVLELIFTILTFTYYGLEQKLWKCWNSKRDFCSKFLPVVLVIIFLLAMSIASLVELTNVTSVLSSTNSKTSVSLGNLWVLTWTNDSNSIATLSSTKSNIILVIFAWISFLVIFGEVIRISVVRKPTKVDSQSRAQ